jgi:hypothetical protein
MSMTLINEGQDMNAIVKHEPIAAVASPLVPQNMDQAVKLAEMMAKGKMMPEHLRGSPGDCLMVIEQAMRWQMSPFAVAQCTSSIKGKLMFEGKLVAAAIEASGAITGSFDYTFQGEKEQRKITVSAVRRGETVPRTVDVWLKDAKTSNDVWVRQPDQQLVYHGTRVWGRRCTPGVILGVYSREEFNAAGEPAAEYYDGPTLDAKAEPLPPEPVATSPAPRQTIGQWLDALQLEISAIEGEQELVTLCDRDDVKKMLDVLKNGAKQRLDKMIHVAMDRVTGVDTGAMET